MHTYLTKKILKERLSYDPDSGVFIWIKTGKTAGWKDQTGYIHIGINGKTYKAHRLAFLYMNGQLPEYEVDHINGDRSDNKWSNIRCVTRTENMRNQRKYKCNTSGHTGVFWHNRLNKWQANIRSEGKLRHIGYYEDIEDAVEARKLAEREFDFHRNHGAHERAV